MSWLLYALIGQLFYNVVNFLDKYLVEREVRDVRALPVFLGVTAFISGSVLFVVTGFPILPLNQIFGVLFTGSLTTIAAALYYYAMRDEAASKVVILLQMTPLHALILGFVILGERIAPQQMLGFMIVLGASLAISFRPGEFGLQLSRSFFFILGSTFAFALSLILFKLLVKDIAFKALLPYESWGFSIGGLLLYLALPGTRQAVRETLPTFSRKGIAIFTLNELFFLTAKVLTFTATIVASAALVSVIAGTSAFIGLVYSVVAMRFLPEIYQEDLSRPALLKKGFMAMIMFIGIALIAWV